MLANAGPDIVMLRCNLEHLTNVFLGNANAQKRPNTSGSGGSQSRVRILEIVQVTV